MPKLAVCSLALLPSKTIELGASHVMTLINTGTPVIKPASIAADRYLFIGVSDIVEPQDGMITPHERHIETLLGFARAWDQARPMLIHCYAGISRSTAAAFISACALRPDRSEAEFAQAIRRASPTATPNGLMVELADDLLGRRGRMVDAIEAIGQGQAALEGVPFELPIV